MSEYFKDKEITITHRSGLFRWRVAETDDGMVSIFYEDREKGKGFKNSREVSINNDAALMLAEALKEVSEHSLACNLPITKDTGQ